MILFIPIKSNISLIYNVQLMSLWHTLLHALTHFGCGLLLSLCSSSSKSSLSISFQQSLSLYILSMLLIIIVVWLFLDSMLFSIIVWVQYLFPGSWYHAGAHWERVGMHLSVTWYYKQTHSQLIPESFQNSYLMASSQCIVILHAPISHIIIQRPKKLNHR